MKRIIFFIGSLFFTVGAAHSIPPYLPPVDSASAGFKSDLQGIADVVEYKMTNSAYLWSKDGRDGYRYDFQAKIRLVYSMEALTKFYDQKTPPGKIKDFADKYELLEYLLLRSNFTPDKWEQLPAGKVVEVKCSSNFIKVSDKDWRTDWKYDGVYCGEIKAKK